MEHFYFDTLDSTSRFLLNLSKKRLSPAVCIAARQTAGYGQFGRDWTSYSGSALFSVLIPFSVPCHALVGLSQQVAITVHQCVSQLSGEHLLLKWPNDLYLADKKLAGILIEVAKSEPLTTWLVVGIGINNLVQGTEGSSVSSLTLTLAQRDALIGLIVHELNSLSKDWVAHSNFFDRDYWLRHDYFKTGELVELAAQGVTESVYYNGLTQEAGVVVSSLSCPSDKKVYAHGAVSLRKRVFVDGS